jgi:quaternary ammonium compound-resistance protein SugE
MIIRLKSTLAALVEMVLILFSFKREIKKGRNKRLAWIYLFLAGLLEMSWPMGFKMAQMSEHKVLWVTFSAVGMAISGFFLYSAQRSIPVGVAYATWAGIGAIGTFILGIYYFHDASTLIGWLGVAFIVMGIIFLKLSVYG